MDWDHDVCLSCDRQTPDGEKFCSQACRLLDLERAGRFSDTPATLPLSAPSWMSWQIPSTTNRSQFQLAPPVNFSAYRQSAQAHSPPSSPKNKSSARDSTSGYFQAHSSSFAQSSQRGLTSSPSRSSLSSVSSSSTSSTVSTPGLTTEAMNQLRSYSGAFDTTRDWKRRVTLG